MSFNYGREEKKWRLWKEAEEKELRGLGVDEDTTEKLHTYDGAVFNSDRRYYLNKLQSVSEVESRKKDIYTAFNKSWDFYSFGEKQNLKEYHENDIAKYKKIYENNFSYLKVLSEINYTKNNQRLMILTVIISIVAIFISILTA